MSKTDTDCPRSALVFLRWRLPICTRCGNEYIHGIVTQRGWPFCGPDCRKEQLELEDRDGEE